MNNQGEILIKLIIPAILLIFWALSNLFNRENNANAAAQARGATPGPRPSGYPGPRPGERERDRNRTVVTTSRPAPPRPRDDEVLIIRAETNPPPGRANNQAPGRSSPTTAQRRNAVRGKAAQVPQPRKPDAPTVRHVDLFDAKISRNVDQAATKPMEIRPLTESVAAVVTQSSLSSVPTMAAGLTPPSTILDLRIGLATQGRIREAFLLNEILQPPMALRNRDRGRR